MEVDVAEVAVAVANSRPDSSPRLNSVILFLVSFSLSDAEHFIRFEKVETIELQPKSFATIDPGRAINISLSSFGPEAPR
jgi:hypothetical protein